MLVLSRGPQDKVVFPNLGITVEILRVNGNRVRVGVDAPKAVRVLRSELEEFAPSDQQPVDETRNGRSADHRFRNQINTAHIALGLAEKQLNAGLNEKALETLRRAVSQFDKLDALAEPIGEEPEQKHKGPAKPRALLVEDDTNESELLAGYLELSGFEVQTAHDGLQAMVQLGRRERPDVVLLDMHMPRMNGAETVKSIRSNPDLAGVQLFAVSGAKPTDVSVSVGPNGVDRWFHKPIKPQELVESMHLTLQGQC